MTAINALTAAHAALADAKSNGYTRRRGQVIAALLTQTERDGLSFSADTQSALQGALDLCIAATEERVQELLQVLVDDHLPDHTVEVFASENGDDDWGYPVAAVITTPDEDELDAGALCDLLADDAEAQADYLFAQLCESL